MTEDSYTGMICSSRRNLTLFLRLEFSPVEMPGLQCCSVKQSPGQAIGTDSETWLFANVTILASQGIPAKLKLNDQQQTYICGAFWGFTHYMECLLESGNQFTYHWWQWNLQDSKSSQVMPAGIPIRTHPRLWQRGDFQVLNSVLNIVSTQAEGQCADRNQWQSLLASHEHHHGMQLCLLCSFDCPWTCHAILLGSGRICDGLLVAQLMGRCSLVSFATLYKHSDHMMSQLSWWTFLW